MTFKAILDGTPTAAVGLNPDLPTELERIINKALEKDRDIRYQHASDIKADLKRMKRDSESGKITSSDSANPRWSRRTIVISALAFVSVIALVAVGVFYFGSGGHAPIDSVAVLPFSDASGDPNAEYLSDGITEVVWTASSTPSSRDLTWNGKPAPSTYLHKQLDVTTPTAFIDLPSHTA